LIRTWIENFKNSSPIGLYIILLANFGPSLIKVLHFLKKKLTFWVKTWKYPQNRTDYSLIFINFFCLKLDVNPGPIYGNLAFGPGLITSLEFFFNTCKALNLRMCQSQVFVFGTLCIWAAIYGNILSNGICKIFTYVLVHEQSS